jgi:ferric enterobactin receptor
MKYKILIFLLLCTNMVFAQYPQMETKGIGKISGKIFDAQTNEAVDFATISLYIQETNQLIDGTVTDEKGSFSLNELKDNTYKISVSFISYETKVIENITMVREKNIALDDIKISVSAAILDEVLVTGERALIEEKVDRLVYNAENDDLSKGGDASDILRKVPLLQVDLEGNVSIRGQSNITVLIDNKPSTIVASSVADALKMIPADQIVKVEVITSPSAKYDAEGSGGIINIITKKNKMQGYYLNLNTGVGIRGSNLGLTGSLRKGKFGMSLGGYGRLFYNKSEITGSQATVLNGLTNLTEQFATSSDNLIFGRYNLTMDYDIDNTQFLSGGIRYGVRSFAKEQLQTTDLYNDAILQNSILRSIDENRPSNSIDVNLDYLKVFKPQQEWSISTLYSRTDMNENFTSDNLDANNSILSSLKNESKNLNQELTFQTDYTTPIKDNQIFEVGAKTIFRLVNSDFAYFLADANSVYVSDETRPSGVLDYQQNVTAAYATYTYSTPNKYTFKGGLRWEQTAITASQNGEAIDVPNYNNIVPTLNMSKSFANFTTVKLGYNRRIQRPGLQQLNPNFNTVNAQSISVGNANLRPELTDNIELGYSRMIKKSYLNISLFGRITDNAINQITYPLDSLPGVILTTFQNIGSEKALGANIFMNLNLTDKWTVNGGVDTYYAMLEGQVRAADGTTQATTNQGFNFGGRLMSQYKLNDGWSLQAFTFMRGRQVQLQGIRGGFGMYSIGVNKDFANKKGSIGFSADNFAGKGWNVHSEMVSPTFTQSNDMLLYNRNVKINFTYKFGKLDFVEPGKKTKSVNNTDVKGDADSNGGAAAPSSGRPARGGKGGAKPKKEKKKKSKKEE